MSLANLFNVTVGYAQQVVMHIMCLLHEQLVHQEVVWHSPQRWLQFRESFEAYPDVVGIMDCTPIWINRPTGRLQRFFYRNDRGCHFINWLLIVDAHGYVTFSQTGFRGHLTDSTCYDYAMVPPTPPGTYLMADLGFARNNNVMVPARNRQRQGRQMNR